MAKEDMQRRLLLSQLQRKRSLKEKYLYQQETPEWDLNDWFDQLRQQLLHKAEFFQDLLQLLDAAPEIRTEELLEKEASELRSLFQQGKTIYGGIPTVVRASAQGIQAKNMLILLGGALAGLEQITCSQNPTQQLVDVVYLLENAGTAL